MELFLKLIDPVAVLEWTGEVTTKFTFSPKTGAMKYFKLFCVITSRNLDTFRPLSGDFATAFYNWVGASNANKHQHERLSKWFYQTKVIKMNTIENRSWYVGGFQDLRPDVARPPIILQSKLISTFKMLNCTIHKRALPSEEDDVESKRDVGRL